MSTLTSPRVNFVGTISWDPGLANNNANIFDARSVEVQLPAGQTNESFPQYLLNNLVRFGIWNLYGTHDARFETNLPNPADNTRIVSGRLSPVGNPLVTDPLLGRPVRLRGKLVDLDPEAVWNSQIFFDDFQLGDNTVGLKATRYKTMHSRWINFRRNLDRLESAGSAGVVWQTVFPRDQIQYFGLEQSPMLTALRNAAEGQNAEGIMLRFATYRTLYFQNGLMNSQPNRPRDLAELQRLHLEGKRFSNPAYGKLVGSVGIWNSGEPTTWPAGRFLVPSNSIPSLAVGGAPFTLGPAVIEIDYANNRLHVDFLHTIPELNRSLDKPNLGSLCVALRHRSELTTLAVIAPDAYGRAAYERDAGIISLPLNISARLRQKLIEGELVLLGQAHGQPAMWLEEQPLVAVAEKRDYYLSANKTENASVRVYDRGQPPQKQMSVLVGRYQGLTRMSDIETVVQTDGDGVAHFTLQSGPPEVADYGFVVRDESTQLQSLPDELDITAGQFLSTRILPADDELEANTSDAQLTWELIYERVLRNWDLVNPIMTLRGLPLNDEDAIRAAKDRILQVISLGAHESSEYMPITRDLSEGKRRLLIRWLNS